MYGAVREGNLRNVQYLHNIKPELLLLKFRGKTPLHVAIDIFGRSGKNHAFIQCVSSLAPEALIMTDNGGDNLLHVLVSHCFETNDDSAEETMRFLLRSIPDAAIATNNIGYTPFDTLTLRNTTLEKNFSKMVRAHLYSRWCKARGEEEVSSISDGDQQEDKAVGSILFVLRRLLLIAGAPSLYPELRKDMNYTARKDALFAFFADRIAEGNQNSSSSSCTSGGSCTGKGGSSSSSGRLDILYLIRNGPSSMELIKQIISFL
jgi:hypothetical protein